MMSGRHIEGNRDVDILGAVRLDADGIVAGDVLLLPHERFRGCSPDPVVEESEHQGSEVLMQVPPDDIGQLREVDPETLHEELHGGEPEQLQTAPQELNAFLSHGIRVPDGQESGEFHMRSGDLVHC